MNTKVPSHSDEKGFGSDDDDRSTKVPNDLLGTTDKKEHSVLEKKAREENKDCYSSWGCSTLGPIYAAIFLDITAISMGAPIVPYLIKSIVPSTETSPQLESRNFLVGIPFAVYYIVAAIGGAALGRISDAIGRRPAVCCLQPSMLDFDGLTFGLNISFNVRNVLRLCRF